MREGRRRLICVRQSHGKQTHPDHQSTAVQGTVECAVMCAPAHGLASFVDKTLIDVSPLNKPAYWSMPWCPMQPVDQNAFCSTAGLL